MTPDSNHTHTNAQNQPTGTHDPALDAGLAAAFAPELTPGGWSHPPLLRDDPSEHAPLVQPGSPEIPRGADNRYQLLGEIARGGMGVVIKGRDPDLGRDLAFKVLRSELANRPAAVQRFVEEAQVGGQLQHPGVVPVYDIGRFADGRPYFAMKLVKGRTLADLLTERKSPHEDRGRFLQSFLQVCQTIAYAHAKGVIHRDLKPSNVMVGAFGEVLVMDWGLAKVLPRGGIADELRASGRREPAVPTEEPTVIHTARVGSGGSETQAGSVMGTPAFMSPEQAAGEIDKLDERSDVFGLGAVLCVILTGRPPYVADSGEAVRLMAVRGELEAAFARLDASGTDAELADLCRRCLAAKRDARPRHAGEVAEALAEYLAGVEQRAHEAEIERVAADARTAEAVNTRREAEARAAAERKRRRVQALLGSLVTLVVLVGGAAASWQWWRAEREEKKTRAALAQVSAEQEKTAAALAQLTEEQTRTYAALNAMTDEGIEKLFASQVEQGEEQKEFVRKVIALYEQAAQARLDTPAGRAVRADGYSRVGRLQRNVGDTAGAAASYRAAVEQYANLHAQFPDVRDYRFGLAVARLDLALTHGETRQHAAAERELTAARVLLTDLLRDDAGNSGYRTQLTRVHNNLAIVYDTTKRTVEALTEREKTIALAEALYRERPNHPDYVHMLATACTNRANRLPKEAPDEKERLHRRALSAVTDYLKVNRATPRFRELEQWGRESLGIALEQVGRTGEAVNELRQSKAIASKLANDYPSVPRYRERLVNVQVALATALKSAGDPVAAHQEHVSLSGAARQLLDADPKNEQVRFNLWKASTERGHRNIALGNFAVARRDLQSAAVLASEALKLGDTKYGWRAAWGENMERLAFALFNLKEYADAEKHLRSALDMYDRIPEPGRGSALYMKDRAACHDTLGQLLHATGKVEAAIAEYRESVRLDRTRAQTHHLLGQALAEGRDFAAATDAFQKAADLDAKKYVSGDFQLGLNRRDAKDLRGAVAAFRKAADRSPKESRIWFELGMALRSLDDLPGAADAFSKYVEAAPNSPWAHGNLGFVQHMQKRYAEAAANYREAVRLGPDIAQLRWEYGMILRLNGEIAEAVVQGRKAVELNTDPKQARAHYELGVSLIAAKDYPGAVAALRESRARAASKETQQHLASSLCSQAYEFRLEGDTDRCLELLEEAVAADPQYAYAHHLLAWVLATAPDARHRDGRRAVREATRACDLTGWNNVGYIDTLTAAHAEAGDYEKAVEYQKKALAFTGLEKPREVEMRERLKLYESRQPYRMQPIVPLAPAPREKR